MCGEGGRAVLADVVEEVGLLSAQCVDFELERFGHDVVAEHGQRVFLLRHIALPMALVEQSVVVANSLQIPNVDLLLHNIYLLGQPGGAGVELSYGFVEPLYFFGFVGDFAFLALILLDQISEVLAQLVLHVAPVGAELRFQNKLQALLEHLNLLLVLHIHPLFDHKVLHVLAVLLQTLAVLRSLYLDVVHQLAAPVLQLALFCVHLLKVQPTALQLPRAVRQFEFRFRNIVNALSQLFDRLL